VAKPGFFVWETQPIFTGGSHQPITIQIYNLFFN